MTVVHDSQLVCYHYLLISHPSEPCVLALPGRTLPYYITGGTHFSQVASVNQAVQVQLGLTVTTLQCLHEHIDDKANRALRLYALDNHSPEWSPPPGATWVGLDQLDTMEFALPEFRPVLQSWLAEWEEVPALRVPWARRGWFAEACQWIEAEIKGLGFQLASPIFQTVAWARGCHLEVNTTGGLFHFKAVPSSFAFEPVLTRVLSKRYPGYIPEVVAVDVNRTWMILRDFGGERLLDHPDSLRWEEALRYFARIQIEMATRVGSLIAIGCPDRHIDQLVWQTAHLLAEVERMNHGLSPENFRMLADYAAAIDAPVYALLDIEIPLSLVHGGLDAGNIILNGKRHVFPDWADSSVSHPFFDMVRFFEQPEAIFPNKPYARERLTEAYLDAWTQFVPMSQLLKALALSQPLEPLHQAIGYYSLILPQVEARARWEIEPILLYYIRRWLQAIQTEA